MAVLLYFHMTTKIEFISDLFLPGLAIVEYMGYNYHLLQTKICY